MANNLGMPTWKCPKCNSMDFYEATELQQDVTGSGGGMSIGFIGNQFGDSGITPMMGQSEKINIRSQTIELIVRKCRKCDTLLGDKDILYSPEERAQIANERKRKAEREAILDQQKNSVWFGIFSFVGAILILFVALFIDTAFFHGGLENMKKGEWLWLTWFTLHILMFLFWWFVVESAEINKVYSYPPAIIISIGTFFAPLWGFDNLGSYFLTFIILAIASIFTVKFMKWANASTKRKSEKLPPILKKEKESSSTRFKCPNCASSNYTQKFEVPNELLGSKIECPKCGMKFLAK